MLLDKESKKDNSLLLKEDREPGIVSWTEKQIIDCIHKIHWVNQGLTGCELGLDLSKCDSCPAKESKYLVQYSSTSTVNNINYQDK